MRASATMGPIAASLTNDVTRRIVSIVIRMAGQALTYGCNPCEAHRSDAQSRTSGIEHICSMCRLLIPGEVWMRGRQTYCCAGCAQRR